MCLYVIYLIISGIKDIEAIKKVYLNTNKLFRYFFIYTTATITIVIQIFIPRYAYLRYTVTLITGPIFLIQLYKTIKCYNNTKFISKQFSNKNPSIQN